MSKSIFVAACGLVSGLGAWTAGAQNYAEHLGISIGAPVYNGQVTFTEEVADDLNEMGVRWIRVEFIANSDWINYTQYDEIIHRANAHGLQVLGLLTYQTKDWYFNSSNWAADWWQDLFAARCVEVVNHYKAFASGPIRFWEVWNEPDSLGYMPAAKFGRMLSVVYPAIKAADPQATIVSGGLTGYWTPTYSYMQQVYQSTYFTEYKNTHGIYPFDIFGLHPYHWTADPNTYLATYMNGAWGLRKLLNNWGDGYKRMWFTEYGWNSAPTADSSINPGGRETYNEWLQGQYFVHAFDITQDLAWPAAPYNEFGPYVEKTFLFCYKDFDLGTPQTREFFGTVRLNFEQKPLFCRYRSIGTPALENLALTAEVTASGYTGPPEQPAMACDGSNFTKWASTSPADDHWLLLDLGAWYAVSEFRLLHAELGHEPDSYNMTVFELQTSASGTAPWTTLLQVSNTSRQPVNILPLATPERMRWVRLHVTDAGQADGAVRLPEMQVLGRPLDVANVQTGYQFAAAVGQLDRQPSSSDLIQGTLATFEAGDVDPEHGVYAYEFSSGGCLDMQWNAPVSGFWAGYPDPSPPTHLPLFTDGSGTEGVVLRDYARAAAVLRYDFTAPTDLRELVVFAANPGQDGRVFQHYDVYVSCDVGMSFFPLAREVRTGAFGASNTTNGASYARVYPGLTGRLVEDATNVRFVFYATAAASTFRDPWQGNRLESTVYQDGCPAVELCDVDGRPKAYGAPIVVEIDVHAARVGDADGDGDVDADDVAGLWILMTGPENLYEDPQGRTFDASPRDGDVDLADVAAVQRGFGAL